MLLCFEMLTLARNVDTGQYKQIDMLTQGKKYDTIK